MSTVEAVRFRHLAAQLTSIEIKDFIYKLSDFNTNIIITALFHYIHNLPLNSTNDVNMITNLVSNIILSRKKKPKAISTSNIKLNELPQSLIGATASFLTQNDYVNLSKCSRSIFIGCNAPNKIQTLDLSDFQDYSNINLTHFPSITKLYLNLNRVNELMRPNTNTTKSVCNELNSITLDQDFEPDFGSNMDTFSEQIPINTKVITHLTFGRIRDHFDSVWKSLSQFQNISYLRFVDIRYNNVLNVHNIVSLPNLRGLAIIDSPDEYQMSLIHLFGHQLESLEFDQYEENDYNLSIINFAKLEELILYKPSLNTIIDIIKTAQNLRQIDIDPRIEDDEEGYLTMTLSEIEESIKKVMGKCQVLQYIAINGYSDTIIATLEGIESGILEMMKRKRSSIRIIIWMDMDESFSLITKDILALIRRIVVCMEQSNTDDFMFVFAGFDGAELKINKRNFLESLQPISTNISIRSDENNICIMNKQCRINGYNVSWKLSPCCEL